jgi:hypothetical protein
MNMDASSRTAAADLAYLRQRVDDLDRRRIAELERPLAAPCAVRQRQLEVMRFELAEVEWHLAQLESR